MIYCSKCGNVLDNNYSCCLRCGAINPNHTDNQNIEFLNVEPNIINTNNDNTSENVVKVNTFFSTIVFIIVNCIGYIVLLLYMSTKYNNIDQYLLACTVSYFYFVCYQLLLKKADLPWWGMFIPIYNLYLINKLSFGNGLIFLIPLIPIVLLFVCKLLNSLEMLLLILKLIYIICMIYPLVHLFCLGRRFGRSGILTVILSFIIIPSIAFSSRYQYEY